MAMADVRSEVRSSLNYVMTRRQDLEDEGGIVY